MKDFITSIAAVLILMMFVMQFTANQAAYTRIMGAEYAIREVSLISEKQGMITSESIAELKAKLADIMGCQMSEIEVSVTGGSPDEGNLENEAVSLGLDVAVPVYNVIGPAGILGIEPSRNVRTHKSLATIVLAPEPEQEEGETAT